MWRHKVILLIRQPPVRPGRIESPIATPGFPGTDWLDRPAIYPIPMDRERTLMNVRREQLDWPISANSATSASAAELSLLSGLPDQTAQAKNNNGNGFRPKKLPRISLHGVAIHAITEKQTIEYI